MKVSAAGRIRIRDREGEVLHTYYDSQGVLTGGVGHTGRMAPPKLTPGMTITKEMSAAWLDADLVPVEAALNASLWRSVTQNQFDALASLIFNVGTGYAHAGMAIINALNAGDVAAAAKGFDLFHRPPEIIKRRDGEKAQFLTPDAAPVAGRPTPSAASSIVGNALDPKAPARGTSPAPGSATQATPAQGNIMVNLLGSVASIIEGVAGKASTVATVATVAPSIIEGAFKSIDEVERGVAALVELAADVRGGKWNEVPEDIKAILAEFRKVMINFGFDHDKINVAAKKLADLDSVETLKAKAA